MIKTRHDYPDELSRVLSAIQDSAEDTQEVEIDFDGGHSVLALACRTIQGIWMSSLPNGVSRDTLRMEWNLSSRLSSGN